ncbi:MAG: DUF4915 domain-containing protein [Planctomycetota bacterium]
MRAPSTRPRPPGARFADEALWAHHHAEWRDPTEVVVQWSAPAQTDARLLSWRVSGDFWGALANAGGTLVVTREYEHLVMALAVRQGRPRVSWMPLPHPSGVAVDQRGARFTVASTRNPNQLFELRPCRSWMARSGERAVPAALQGVLLPARSVTLPGCLYLHDLAYLDGALHGNAVAMNAVVRIAADGSVKPVWWPRSIEALGARGFLRNSLQLNSIGGGPGVRDAYFSASAAKPSARRPGHLNFPVDGRGVIFSGRTRRVVAEGLTRPHSVRRLGRELFVDNSGYGELCRIDESRGRCEPVLRLPGWTRGLCGTARVAFVGTSRVIPRFRHYAPGLQVRDSLCGVHAVDLRSGEVLGSLQWPSGNQIFALDLLGTSFDTPGFPLEVGARGAADLARRIYFLGRPGPSPRRAGSAAF